MTFERIDEEPEAPVPADGEPPPGRDERVAREEAEAAREAAAIGGDRGLEPEDPAAQPVEEAGGGEAEGFEQAEDQLREHAEHGRDFRRPTGDRLGDEEESDRSSASYGEPDRVDPSEPDVAGEDDVLPARDEPTTS
jgi:hypothetical protein